MEPLVFHKDLFIYLVTRTDSGGYDSYDSFVVVASSERAARHTYPNRGVDDWKWDHARELWVDIRDGDTIYDGHAWVDDPQTLTVTRVGSADPSSVWLTAQHTAVICASFNAG